MTSPLRQPPGWSRHAAILDDAAPHQIRLTVTNNGNHPVWSCTCRRSHGGYPPLGPADGVTADGVLAAHRAHVAAAVTGVSA